MANKELVARVRLDTKQVESAMKRLDKQINGINKAINKTKTSNIEKQLSRAGTQATKLRTKIGKVNAALSKTQTNANKVTTALGKSSTKLNSISRQTQRWATAQRSVNSSIKTTNSSLGMAITKLKGFIGAYAGLKTVELAITTSDTITSTENRLNNLPNGNEDLTAKSMDKIYSASQRSRSGYQDMLSNVSKTMTLAGDSFQGNIDNAIRFQEIMAKAYTVGGASATDASTSMYQLVQALGSGILQGDELRSVREGAPIAYKEIEKFAQKVFETEESLKDLASEGVITSDIIVAAIMESEEQINKSFDNTKITFGQAWDMIKNMATKAFEPALQSLNDALNNPAVQQGIMMLGQGLLIIGNIISWVFKAIAWAFDILSSFFNWCAENWSWLSRVILTILTIIAVSMAVILFPKFIAWLSYIAFAIAYYTVLGATAVASAIQTAIAWIAANWVLLLIIVVIIAVISAVIWLADSFEDAIGMIVGGIMTGVAFVWNLFLALVDFILGIVNHIWNSFANFANFFANVFVDPIGSIIRLFGGMADNVLGIIETIASAIDKVFGSNLADAVSGWRGSLDAKITAAAEKYGNGKYEEKVAKSNLTAESLGLSRWAYTDAYDSGYKWGSDGAAWLKDKVSGIGDMLTGVGLPDPYDPSMALGNAYDPSGVNDDIANGLKELGNIEDDTSKISDSMDLRDDDFEFLRRLAEMEWRNEFTTAEIKVDMTNHNTVNGDRDLDGIVAYLSDVLREEMSNVAYGVHY